MGRAVVEKMKEDIRRFITDVTGEGSDTDDFAKLAGHGKELILGEVCREAVDVNIRGADRVVVC